MATKAKTLNVAAIQKIFALLKQRHDEDGALLEELERLIAGGKGIGEIMKECYATWNEFWSVQHGGAYAFVFHEDAPQMKRLVRTLGQEELTARMFHFISDRNEWLVKHKHPFKVFVKQNNSYASATAARADDDAPPVDCKHTPPCRSDQEHTKKKLEARS